MRRYRKTRRCRSRNRKGRRANRSRRSRKQIGGAQVLQIAYLQGPVAEGQLLQESQTQTVPVLQNLPSLLQPEHTYLLVLYDPDVPPAAQPGYLHWLKADITQANSEGTTLVPYKGPAPPPGSGTHRYIFTLVDQKGVISAPRERAHFDGPAFLRTQGQGIAETQFTVAAPK